MITSPLPAATLHPDPYPTFARLRREAPVWRLPGANAYLVSTWALVAEATGRIADSGQWAESIWIRRHDRLPLLVHPSTGAADPDRA